jgi:hypothetical protein
MMMRWSTACVPRRPRFTFRDDASCREHMALHPSCNLQGHGNPSHSPIYRSYILGRLRRWIGSHHLSNTYSGTRIRQARTRESRELRPLARGTARHGEHRKGDEGRKTARTAPEQVAACVRSRIPSNVLQSGLYSRGAGQAMFASEWTKKSTWFPLVFVDHRVARPSQPRKMLVRTARLRRFRYSRG